MRGTYHVLDTCNYSTKHLQCTKYVLHSQFTSRDKSSKQLSRVYKAIHARPHRPRCLRKGAHVHSFSRLQWTATYTAHGSAVQCTAVAVPLVSTLLCYVIEMLWQRQVNACLLLTLTLLCSCRWSRPSPPSSQCSLLVQAAILSSSSDRLLFYPPTRPCCMQLDSSC